MILVDYRCDACGTDQEHMVDAPAPDDVACEFCDARATWQPSPLVSRVATTVVRGPVAKPDSPMFCDTRALGEGQKLSEWKADRQKLYQERRHREFKRGD
jgi:hypothetical protein